MLARGEARSREVIAAQCDLWKAEKNQGLGIRGSTTQTSRMQVCVLYFVHPFELGMAHKHYQALLLYPDLMGQEQNIIDAAPAKRLDRSCQTA